ncbi:hypothetical protein OG604_37850 [Streptomyces sp. NBC_01231]|nr:hypothetical protein OG604_37850 [Streptomyces sp. NBC_01231]
MRAGPLPGIYDPIGPGKLLLLLLFGFFAATAETERENIGEPTLEGLETVALKARYGGRPPVTDDMLPTVPQRKALGESVEQSADRRRPYLVGLGRRSSPSQPHFCSRIRARPAASGVRSGRPTPTCI